MRRRLEGHETPYPVWAVCLDMADGNPLIARDIFDNLDAEWFFRHQAWTRAHNEAKKK